MVSAFYISDDGCTKHFSKNDSFFGWKTIKELWQREMKRSEAGQMMVVPRLKSSYVFQDSWTRLNVTPESCKYVHMHGFPIHTHQN